MSKSAIAFAAALALPLAIPVHAQTPAAIDLDSVAPAAGAWSYHRADGGSYAAFLDAHATQRFIIRCNRAARTVSLVRTNVPAAAPTLAIWTTSTNRSVPSRFDATKSLTADLAATDTMLDAIAFSRGRFATAAAGAPILALPTWPEIARVIEDCRS